jgi:hypothetical protein
MYFLRADTHSKLVFLSFSLAITTLWCLLRGYQGLDGDAQIYAFQALARINRPLSTDLYLQNTSQDEFTVFSPLYATLIRALGLQAAARTLTLVFICWFYVAAWKLAEALTDRNIPWLAIGLLMIASGDYGGSGVFHISECYLSARLPAEALVVTAFACHFRRRTFLAWLIAIGALFVHPLIALPGLITLVALNVSAPVAVGASLGGVLVALVISVAASKLPTVARVLPLMDSEWLYVVRERSQFLFPQLWNARDWGINIRPLLFLLFMAAALPKSNSQRLCVASLCVGLSGLSLAFIPGLVGPVALLVQGQAWRWVWIACFLSVLLLPITITEVWRDRYCGALCTVLLIGAWALPGIYGTACIGFAIICWLARRHIGDAAIPHVRSMVIPFSVALIVWAAFDTWTSAAFRTDPHGAISPAMIKDLAAVKMTAAVLVGVLWRGLQNMRGSRATSIVSLSLIIVTALLLPDSLKNRVAFASDANMAEFADWRSVIPPTSSVLVTPTRDVGAFVWFTLRRPNYLALDQSAGVVFSRNTALEVQRRSQVLLPLVDPSWKILSGKRNARARPLTPDILIRICADPQLGFVISPQKVAAFPLLSHKHEGLWMNWNLYDCANIRDRATQLEST